MQSTSRFLDDLARVANGAVSTMVGIKDEIEALVRQQIERFLAEADMVPRDEFDAVKAMAAKARGEQEKLEKRVGRLEAKLGVKSTAKRRPRAKPSKPKTAKNS
ncbi:MAG: accessory factor UbiK family protein [Pseudomonadota bacterium]|nr:accessory factor UbiK family protein [Pseudomonadota bacterium]